MTADIPSEGGDAFALSALRLCRHLQGGRGATAKDVALIQGRLERLAARRFPELKDGISDVVAETLARFAGAAQVPDRVDCDQNPSGYLTKICMNIAKDQLRRERGIVVLDLTEPERTDDILNRLASHDEVKRAMKAARSSSDDLAVRVLLAFLDLSVQSDASPSDRDVAREAATSHVTVRRVFAQAAAYLTGQSDATWPSRIPSGKVRNW